jgi:hypothetical protein
MNADGTATTLAAAVGDSREPAQRSVPVAVEEDRRHLVEASIVLL